MKLIIWLWNPWDKYKNTRHNIWFMFLDFFAEKNNFPNFSFEKKFNAEISEKNLNSEKIILIKPQTFMNLSWESLQKIVNYYKVDTKNIIIIYDDISMDFWKVRHRQVWSHWWHNGIKDITRYIWDKFDRVKVGVWIDKNYEVSDWVLSKFKNIELGELDKNIFSEVENRLVTFIKNI